MRMLSLFSGIGGIDLAAQWAGVETVAFCEIDQFCQKVLKKHWPDVPIFPDIKKLTKEVLDAEGIGRIDIVAGGYPCQPFSTAGKRKGSIDDRYLWPEMFRIVSELRPTWVIGENVAGHILLGIDDVLSDLDGIKYAAQPFIIPACSVDARHQRYRVFTVAHTQGERCGETRRNSQRPEEWITGGGEALADTHSPLSGYGDNDDVQKFGDTTKSEGNKIRSFPKWSAEPDVGRVAYGVPARVDRLKSLGNAVVPAQIYPIFAAIMAIEKGAT